MSEFNPQPDPPGAVRVHVPSEILNDLGRFQKVQASILGRLGHPGCTSGIQVVWQTYENWVVDHQGGVHPVAPGAVVSPAHEA